MVVVSTPAKPERWCLPPPSVWYPSRAHAEAEYRSLVFCVIASLYSLVLQFEWVFYLGTAIYLIWCSLVISSIPSFVRWVLLFGKVFLVLTASFIFTLARSGARGIATDATGRDN